MFVGIPRSLAPCLRRAHNRMEHPTTEEVAQLWHLQASRWEQRYTYREPTRRLDSRRALDARYPQG
jgi:hypothetical protein